jgi:hypothetical protein
MKYLYSVDTAVISDMDCQKLPAASGTIDSIKAVNNWQKTDCDEVKIKEEFPADYGNTDKA